MRKGTLSRELDTYLNSMPIADLSTRTMYCDEVVNHVEMILQVPDATKSADKAFLFFQRLQEAVQASEASAPSLDDVLYDDRVRHEIFSRLGEQRIAQIYGGIYGDTEGMRENYHEATQHISSRKWLMESALDEV